MCWCMCVHICVYMCAFISGFGLRIGTLPYFHENSSPSIECGGWLPPCFPACFSICLFAGLPAHLPPSLPLFLPPCLPACSLSPCSPQGSAQGKRQREHTLPESQGTDEQVACSGSQGPHGADRSSTYAAILTRLPVTTNPRTCILLLPILVQTLTAFASSGQRAYLSYRVAAGQCLHQRPNREAANG